MYNKLILLLFILSLLSLNSIAQEDRILVDRIVAIVGDKIILHSDIELQYQQLLLEGELPEEFRCVILDQALAQKMLHQQAVIDSVMVGEDDIEGELNRRIRYFVSMIGSEEKLEEYYGKSIIQIKDEFRKDIEEQLLSQKMRAKILENVKVTPAEVKAFYNSIPTDSLPFFNEEFEVGEIVIIPEINQEVKEYARESLEGIRERVINGEDFCTLARLYSEDPGSAENCGSLGFIKRGEMVPEFEAAAFRLANEEISQVIESKFGFHIIQMLEKKGEKINVRHILLRPRVTSYDLMNAKAKADSIRTLIVEGGMKFSEAAFKFSEDEDSKNQGGMMTNQQTGTTFFETDQLDKSVYFAIENINPGDISTPQPFQTLDGTQAYRILLLKSVTEAHVANLKEDYSRIKSAATQQKEEREFDNWLREKSSETYVFIDDSYHRCPLMKNWIKKEAVIEKTYD